MKVLLLGVTGNLGLRLLPALLSHKHQVVAYVRNERKLKELLSPEIIAKTTIVVGDATDSNGISNALIKNQCDAIVNSAGNSSIFPWQAPRMQEIVDAAATAAVDASEKLGRPIRAWLLGGMTVLDCPGKEGTQLVKYLPLFTEHSLTFKYLSSKPLDRLEWSMFCPSTMTPASKDVTLYQTPRNNPIVAAADVPPNWWPVPYVNGIPFFGLLSGIAANGARYNTTLEDCADFIADDLEKGERKFIGHRVGVIDAGKDRTK